MNDTGLVVECSYVPHADCLWAHVRLYALQGNQLLDSLNLPIGDTNARIRTAEKWVRRYQPVGTDGQRINLADMVEGMRSCEAGLLNETIGRRLQ